MLTVWVCKPVCVHYVWLCVFQPLVIEVTFFHELGCVLVFDVEFEKGHSSLWGCHSVDPVESVESVVCTGLKTPATTTV